MDIVGKASSSGGGPAGQGSEESGEVMQSIQEEAATMGGFYTPRRSSRTSLFPEAIRPPSQGGIHGLVAKIGEFFKAPAVAWLPSPIPSPPVPRGALPSQSSGGAEVFPKPGPGTAAGNARSAIGGDRRSMNNPNSLTPSSSEIPTEAIQAEVQRQLGGLLDRLQQMESENQQLQRQLQQATAEKESQHAARETATVEGQQSSRMPWRGTLGALWGERAESRPQPVEDFVEEQGNEQAQRNHGGGNTYQDSTNTMLEVLARSMTQLQDMQAKTLQKNLDEDSPEVVKSNATSLPMLSAPEGIATGIALQDWLAQIAIAMQDLSPSSSTWWAKVVEVVQDTYTTWLGSTPLERLQLQPQNYVVLSQGKWTRVNARACTMILQSLTEAVRQDLIARRVVQHAVLIMFRLHTMYQPGGASEKTLVLSNLQSPTAGDSLDEVLTWLRSWPRWIQRCQDLSMTCPDGTVLAKTLTAMTYKHISEVGDAQFRTQLLRSTLRIDGQPTLECVKRYHQHLQAELEAVAAARTLPPTPSPKIKAVGAITADKQTTPTTPTSTGGRGPCKYFYKATGCRRGQKCPYSHDLGSLSKADRGKKCLCCGAEDTGRGTARLRAENQLRGVEYSHLPGVGMQSLLPQRSPECRK